MRLTIIGCAGSFAGPNSPASSYLLRADDAHRTWMLLLDLGNGALGALQRHCHPDDLDAVFLSHLHPDHCADVTGLYVMRKYRPGGPLDEPLPIYGPDGAGSRLAQMYHGLESPGMDEHFAFSVVAEGAPVTVGPFTVMPYAVNHPVEAFGYRVESGGATLAFTGDTDTCPALSPLMHDADLALVDSAFVEGRDSTRGIHLTARRAAEAAVGAGGVKRLMLTHLPAWNDPATSVAEAAAVWPGSVELAEPGQTYVVGSPAHP